MDTQFNDITLHPIGVVRSITKQPFLIADETGIKMRDDIAPTIDEVRKTEKTISDVVLNRDLAEHLEGIEEYSHIKIIYWAHDVPRKARDIKKVHPMGNPEYPLVGLFSTCSPARPNPILTTVVRLVGKEGTTLHVTGLDAIDGSPVLDIKPHVGEFYPAEGVKIPDWMEKIQSTVMQRKTND
ncbi:SAM-dependent methyltransferase [Methanococcus maripaludis]|uniref:S-adenosyl-L-methionine-binding protein n=1 Tax=Methanococcus maripaludis TaxID=39152 RepID=A0A2L1C968_METMI|nr:SAM-dependent methyltransferase [Methanococcus maripaludis]AVB75887.1 S-adenosyl-L-methionine-binding protein [Methanococcus maripaludis]MBA2864362.1 tRNA-Thr(GGU) m(6)t(6)A37 methyltransferase TsaA [Methanococcus maripaludis]MBB6497287.1 tRNA-Thr(GGU) m(6)t(6)A37 methyltransferase TsaA [Methanococcus maripaludis]